MAKGVDSTRVSPLIPNISFQVSLFFSHNIELFSFLLLFFETFSTCVFFYPLPISAPTFYSPSARSNFASYSHLDYLPNVINGPIRLNQCSGQYFSAFVLLRVPLASLYLNVILLNVSQFFLWGVGH